MARPKSSFAASLALHAGAALLLFSIVSVRLTPPTVARMPTFVDLAAYHRALHTAGPEGGGGDRSALPVSRGRLPKPSPRPFAPPMVLIEARDAPLLVQPALLTSSDVNENLPQWGDPLALPGLPSNGLGSGGGMGPGEGGGVGPSHGPGSGPGGVAQSARSGFTPPQVIYRVDPEFSDEARRAKYQGSVLVMVDVDTTGRASNIRVVKSLGLGLDEKAIEAVSRWRFRPALKDGKPVTVPASIEVNFHLL